MANMVKFTRWDFLIVIVLLRMSYGDINIGDINVIVDATTYLTM